MTTIEEIREFCLSLKGTTEDIKWEHHLCFNVGGKMFLITSPDESPVSASFKTSEELFDTMSANPGCIPAPYMAKNKWIKIDDISRFSMKEWEEILTLSHQLIAQKLTKKLQKELGIDLDRK